LHFSSVAQEVLGECYKLSDLAMRPQSERFWSVIPGALAVAAAYNVGLWGLYLQPQMLSPLMAKFGAAETDIGMVYGAENFAYFIALLLTAIPVTQCSRTKMAILGAAIAVVGSVACAFTDNLGTFMLYRCVVSVGGGIVSGAATASGAGSKDPVRVFALAGMLYLFVFSVGRKLVPVGLENFGETGIFLGSAVFCAVTIPIYGFLNPPIKAASSSVHFWTLIRNAPYRLYAVLAMLGLFIYELGQNAVFTYMDKLGEKTGLAGDDRGSVYLLSFSLELLGGGLAAWMGSRFGKFKPLVFGLGLNISSAAMFTVVQDPIYYIYLLFLWNFSYAFSMPYITGTLSALDKEGRWAVAGDAIWNFSSTPGPIIATVIVTNFGYNPLALWVFTSGALGITLFCYTGRKADKLGLDG
jgi:predicted MFS family arabinose efflux permease